MDWCVQEQWFGLHDPDVTTGFFLFWGKIKQNSMKSYQ